MIREGRFDVVVAAGPRLETWPSVGVNALSSFCASMGLSVGVFGGEAVRVRGVIPLPGTGALVIAEDVQRRIHRLHARSVVRVSAPSLIPDPFPGSHSEGIVPLPMAARLWRSGAVLWEPATVILGTGNRALRFGSELLEGGAPEVICLEPHAEWEAKRYAGWDVERRRFESAGGELVEGNPVRLERKGSSNWELRARDSRGVRILEVARVVSAGPFYPFPPVREYPAGSLLFEMVQTAPAKKEDDVGGWMAEEENGRWIAAKIIKALIGDLGSRRDEFEQTFKRTRARLKRYAKHFQEPFLPNYQGKWIAAADARRMREFAGVPKAAYKERLVASVECFESISCRVCRDVCPEGAIDRGRVLKEDLCSGCGICVSACPSRAISLLQERENESTVVLPVRGGQTWKPGTFISLLNRRGESLGTGRIGEPFAELTPPLFRVEIPSHLIWEARNVRAQRTSSAVDEAYLKTVARDQLMAERIEISVGGNRRLVRAGITVSSALYELGQQRPGDALHCADGSCGLCKVEVDGVKKLGCQTQIHRGMRIDLPESRFPVESPSAEPHLCACLGISREQILERLRQGTFQSPEAALSITHVGEGECHGQRCMEGFKRLLVEEGIDVTQWIDWRFPWSEWTLGRS